MDDNEFHEEVSAYMATNFPINELYGMFNALDRGCGHLETAIEEFNGLKHGTETDDLVDYLEEARDARRDVSRAIKLAQEAAGEV